MESGLQGQLAWSLIDNRHADIIPQKKATGSFGYRSSAQHQSHYTALREICPNGGRPLMCIMLTRCIALMGNTWLIKCGTEEIVLLLRYSIPLRTSTDNWKGEARNVNTLVSP